ncbi:PDZ domain-containing protein [Arcanobacterium hippocoleae]|uniref:endopeptidase La n=1 Tax=Arcanobacterium hippocoleae TaxID=149017 RepID=A0ABU1T301_9ACTO|nr:S16 family serine protease [Arcanobacterium hippocoleae]MDR6939256.1 PDZ domain-containing protein [Arcanobacterium hippocoleae]
MFFRRRRFAPEDSRDFRKPQPASNNLLQTCDIPDSEKDFAVSVEENAQFAVSVSEVKAGVGKTHPVSLRTLACSHTGRTILAGICFCIFVLLAMFLPSSFLVQTAGPAINVNSDIDGKPIVQISGVPTEPSETKLFMTTVSAWGAPTQGVPGAQALAALLKGDWQLIPLRAFYPPEVSADEVAAQNNQLMANSQDSAALLAFELAGFAVQMDVTVVGVDQKKPSGKVLQPGDVIRAIGVNSGHATVTDAKLTPIKSHYELAQILDRTPPKSRVKLEIERAGERKIVEFATLPYPPDNTGWVHPGSLLGVAITVENVKIPGKVEYIVEGIGGPSAGNMFTLALYDLLTPGSLGGKAKIAGTGTVAWDGDVGPIGGIVHKLRGAAKAGATDFLAPAENCGETIGMEPRGLNIWAVRSTDESIKVVKAIAAGDTAGLRTCKDVAGAS